MFADAPHLNGKYTVIGKVISGIETVWSSQKKAIRKKEERAMLDSNINLVYDPESPIGVGGIKFSVNF